MVVLARTSVDGGASLRSASAVMMRLPLPPIVLPPIVLPPIVLPPIVLAIDALALGTWRLVVRASILSMVWLRLARDSDVHVFGVTAMVRTTVLRVGLAIDDGIMGSPLGAVRTRGPVSLFSTLLA